MEKIKICPNQQRFDRARKIKLLIAALLCFYGGNGLSIGSFFVNYLFKGVLEYTPKIENVIVSGLFILVGSILFVKLDYEKNVRRIDDAISKMLQSNDPQKELLLPALKKEKEQWEATKIKTLFDVLKF